ncbi:MAG: hypothetical protein QM767_03885 [Anaeromyxobacter sp.]
MNRTVPRLAALLLAGLTPLLAACGGDGGGGGQELHYDQPAYAIQSIVWDDQGTTTYVAVLDTLDRSSTVALAGAREFAGYAPVDAFAGKLVIGSGETPILTRYAVADDGTWVDEATLGFGAYTSSSLDAVVYVDEGTAYTALATSDWVIWDPAAFAITSTLALPSEELPASRDGLARRRGYASEVRDGIIFQPYYYADDSYHAYTGVSPIAVIDAAAEEYLDVLDAPCPHLHITSRDEAGNLYFSNGQGSIAAAVLDEEHPRNCMVRVKAGEQALDASFTTTFAALTDGREGSNLFYIGDGLAFMNVYHAERDDLGPDTTFGDVDYSASYHLWTVDLDTMQAAPMAGVGYGGGQYTAFRVDDRVFVLMPAADYSTTAVYEIDATGTATHRFDVEGWAFKLMKVR